MATHHAEPGEVVDLATWADDLPQEHSKAIAKTDNLELARLVIGAGVNMHSSGYCSVEGPVVLHCLEGEIEVATPSLRAVVKAGQLVYLLGRTEHTVSGIRDAVVLLTIVLRPG